jgi:hypothetical protein
MNKIIFIHLILIEINAELNSNNIFCERVCVSVTQAESSLSGFVPVYDTGAIFKS